MGKYPPKAGDGAAECWVAGGGVRVLAIEPHEIELDHSAPAPCTTGGPLDPAPAAPSGSPRHARRASGGGAGGASPARHPLGADRYSWQGNLIALGTVLAIQPWPIHRIRASAILGVVGVVGIMLAGSRQALAAAAVGLVLSALYWGASRYLGGVGTVWSRLRSAVTGGYVILPLALLVLTAGYLAVTYAGYAGVHLWGGASTSSSCHCVTDRIVSLETNAGDRDKLFAHGVQLFLSNPILGGGLGSFAGAVPDSLHPGHFYQYPHNVPLEIASETGIVGALLILFPLLLGWAALFWRGVKLASAPIASTLMLLAIFFTVANVSGDIPSERGLWIVGIVAFKLGVDYIWSRHRSRNMARAA